MCEDSRPQKRPLPLPEPPAQAARIARVGVGQVDTAKDSTGPWRAKAQSSTGLQVDGEPRPKVRAWLPDMP